MLVENDRNRLFTKPSNKPARKTSGFSAKEGVGRAGADNLLTHVARDAQQVLAPAEALYAELNPNSAPAQVQSSTAGPPVFFLHLTLQ